MDVSRLRGVAILTAASLIEFYTCMGVRQAGTNPHRSTGGAVSENAAADPRNAHKGKLAAGPDLILFVIAGAGLALLIPPDRRGHFFLGRR
jgi:hypothetical protein